MATKVSNHKLDKVRAVEDAAKLLRNELLQKKRLSRRGPSFSVADEALALSNSKESTKLKESESNQVIEKDFMGEDEDVYIPSESSRIAANYGMYVISSSLLVTRRMDMYLY
jgi:hypothetical protein